MTLQKTSLYDVHVALKGRMVPFAGYDMPVQYAGVMREHEAIRKNVGLFDVSHMGEFWITGPNARAWLNRVTTNDVNALYDGRCQYSLLCYDNGTVVDDIIVSQIKADKYLMVVNASNQNKDWDWLQKHREDGVELTNIGPNFSLIAVQGPKSAALLQILYGDNINQTQYYHFMLIPDASVAPLGGIFISRTGYTGEDGFEILVPNDRAVSLWNSLLESGKKFDIQACGLGARDTLRLESAYSLYGHELSDEITALEAGLGWVVKFAKGSFIGSDALQAEKARGVHRKIVGFEMVDSAIARDGAVVYVSENEPIGRVTSGTHSPTLGKALGLMLIESEFAKEGTELFVDIRGQLKKMRVAAKPFYKRAS